jgi:hypothetical protein
MISCQSSCAPSYVALLSDDDECDDGLCEEVRYEEFVVYNNDNGDEEEKNLSQEAEEEEEEDEEEEIPEDLDDAFVNDMEVVHGIYM